MYNNRRNYFLILFTLVVGITNLTAQSWSAATTTTVAESEKSVDTVSSDSLLMRLFSKEQIPITHNNQITLLTSGELKFIDLFQHISEAKHHIHLEYFNFRNDSIANALFDLLAEKAKEGVEIRALFDAFGNWSNNQPLEKKHLKAIRERGIEIIKYDPIRFPWINHVFDRDHRKIAIIDGKVGYTGGMNIADYYIHGLPEVGDWRDMHIRMEGDAVSDLQDIFLTIWNKTTKQKIGGDSYYPLRTSSKEGTAGGKTVAIVDRIPYKAPKTMRKAYIQSFDVAQHKVQLINPYFTPTSSIKRAIRRALKRGVEVEILVPAKSDIPFTPQAALYSANKLREKGAEIYMFNGGFHHAKIMMVDSLFCTVGSTNLNSRSLRYDFEVNAFIFSPETTQELITIFEQDKLNSTLLTEEGYYKEGVWKRFGRWFAYLFTPFL